MRLRCIAISLASSALTAEGFVTASGSGVICLGGTGAAAGREVE